MYHWMYYCYALSESFQWKLWFSWHQSCYTFLVITILHNDDFMWFDVAFIHLQIWMCPFLALWKRKVRQIKWLIILIEQPMQRKLHRIWYCDCAGGGFQPAYLGKHVLVREIYQPALDKILSCFQLSWAKKQTPYNFICNS